MLIFAFHRIFFNAYIIIIIKYINFNIITEIANNYIFIANVIIEYLVIKLLVIQDFTNFN